MACTKLSVCVVCVHLQASAEVRRGGGKTEVKVAIVALLSYASMNAVLVHGILCGQGSNQSPAQAILHVVHSVPMACFQVYSQLV